MPSTPRQLLQNPPRTPPVTGSRLWVSAVVRDEFGRLLIVAPPWEDDRYFYLPGGEVADGQGSPCVALRAQMWTQLGLDMTPTGLLACSYDQPVLATLRLRQEPGVHLVFDCGHITQAQATAMMTPTPSLVGEWKFATMPQIEMLTHPRHAARAAAALSIHAALPFIEQLGAPEDLSPSEGPSSRQAQHRTPRPDAFGDTWIARTYASHVGEFTENDLTTVLPTSDHLRQPQVNQRYERPAATVIAQQGPSETDNEKIHPLLLSGAADLELMARILAGLRRLDDKAPIAGGTSHNP